MTICFIHIVYFPFSSAIPWSLLILCLVSVHVRWLNIFLLFTSKWAASSSIHSVIMGSSGAYMLLDYAFFPFVNIGGWHIIIMSKYFTSKLKSFLSYYSFSTYNRCSVNFILPFAPLLPSFVSLHKTQNFFLSQNLTNYVFKYWNIVMCLAIVWR